MVIKQFLPVRTYPIARTTQGGNWQVELTHSVDFHRIFSFTRGQGRISFGSAHRAYGPNSVVFIPAGCPHSFEVRTGVFGNIIEIDDHEMLSMPDAPMHLRVRDMQEQVRLSGLVENLHQEINTEARGQDLACLFHAGLIGVWLDRTAEKLGWYERKKTSQESLVAKFQTLVEQRFSSGDNIGVYSKTLDVTPTHLTRCCRSTVGSSALSLLNERIHHEARVLLRDTSLPVKQVAQDLGFTSAAYFTRAFAQNANCSPSDFRLQNAR